MAFSEYGVSRVAVPENRGDAVLTRRQTTRYTFGTVAGTGFYRPTTNFLATQTTFDPRIIQLAAKIVF